MVDNIEFAEGMDTVRKEIDQYVDDDDVKNLSKEEGLEKFWMEVYNLTDGEERWKRFVVLP